jgi:hypothetical protein
MEINVFAARVFIAGVLVTGKEGKFPQLSGAFFGLDLDLHTSHVGATPTARVGKISNICLIGNIFPISNICPIGNI